MKSITPLLVVTLIALAASPLARAQSSPAAAEKSADTGGTKAKIKQMEDAWAAAEMQKDHGAAIIAEMIAADYSGVSSKGVIQNKAAMVEKMKSETDVTTSAVNDTVEVNLYGPNVATACGKSTEKGKDKDGKEFDRVYGWVDTWMERNGKWECIASSGMLLPDKK